MALQDRPVCWFCTVRIDHDWVFESLCGHEECPSHVFHGLCLMQWRERRAEMQARLDRFRADHWPYFKEE